jgi:hypothetical protein
MEAAATAGPLRTVVTAAAARAPALALRAMAALAPDRRPDLAESSPWAALAPSLRLTGAMVAEAGADFKAAAAVDTPAAAEAAAKGTPAGAADRLLRLISTISLSTGG